jgi:hypothetical protein
MTALAGIQPEIQGYPNLFNFNMSYKRSDEEERMPIDCQVYIG